MTYHIPRDIPINLAIHDDYLYFHIPSLNYSFTVLNSGSVCGSTYLTNASDQPEGDGAFTPRALVAAIKLRREWLNMVAGS